jgi:hypothetical protein
MMMIELAPLLSTTMGARPLLTAASSHTHTHEWSMPTLSKFSFVSRPYLQSQ